MIVLDTSYLVAWANEHDVHHKRALDALPTILEAGALLPEYVLLETATVLAARKDLDASVRFCEALLDAREAEFVACGPVFLDAFRIFRTQRRYQLSLVDAAIVAIARSRGAQALATFDDALAKASGLPRIPP